jgi:hypothetical protein
VTAGGWPLSPTPCASPAPAGGARGGAVCQAAGTLTIDSSTISQNAADGGAGGGTPGSGGGSGADSLGGGVYSAGSVQLTSSVISHNSAGWFRSGGTGGGLYVAGGSLCLDQATLDAIFGNFADSYPDVFGPYTLC